MRSWALLLSFGGALACSCDTAPEGTAWRIEPIASGACANGSAFHVAVSAGSQEDLLIVLEGGGACWDDFRCNTASVARHLHDDLEPDEILSRARLRENLLFSRSPTESPFAAATFVEVPYCTGDMHLGDEVHAYAGGTIHHVGSRNVAGALALAHELVPDPARVWFVGMSAGGIGVAAAWERARATFPDAELHVLSDSGAPLVVPDAVWATMRENWSPVLPSECLGCEASFGALTDHHMAATDGRGRFGLLHHTGDAVVAAYFGLSPGWIEGALTEFSLRAAATENHRVMLLPGRAHLVFQQPDIAVNGVTAREWVFAFASGEHWDNVAP